MKKSEKDTFDDKAQKAFNEFVKKANSKNDYANVNELCADAFIHGSRFGFEQATEAMGFTIGKGMKL